MNSLTTEITAPSLSSTQYGQDVSNRFKTIDQNFDKIVESDLFDIYIASAAHPQACWYKYDWIKQYIPFMKKDKLIFISHKYLLNGDLLFDDAPHNLFKFKGNVVCFDKKYNRNLTQLDRVKDWNEFSEYLIDKFYTF